MDEKKFGKEQRKVVGTNRVEPIEINYIDSQYKLVPQSNCSATPTGLVTVAELVTRSKELPVFRMRWDHRKEELDIDIYIGGKIRNDLWRKSYDGHHPKLNYSGGRDYTVEITKIDNPKRTIFKGIVRVALCIGLNQDDGISVSENVALKIVDPSSN